MTRTAATLENVTVGTTVYKGKGKAPLLVVAVLPTWGCIIVKKPTSKDLSPTGTTQNLRHFTVEV